MRSLSTSTLPNVTPYKPFPLVRSADEKPARDFPNIFFPASFATVNRDVTFGAQHDTAVVNLGRFFPNTDSNGNVTGNQGTEQVVNSIGLDIGYSTSSDYTPPQILQTGAVQNGNGTMTAFVRSSDAAGLSRVAVLYHEQGSNVWNVLQLDHGSGDLWSKTFTGAIPIQLDSQAEDVNGNVAYSFNKAVNFQSVPASAVAAPAIVIDNPLPATNFTLNQQVRAAIRMLLGGGDHGLLGRSRRRQLDPERRPARHDDAGAPHVHCNCPGSRGPHGHEERHLHRCVRLRRLPAAGGQPADAQYRQCGEHDPAQVGAQQRCRECLREHERESRRSLRSRSDVRTAPPIP